MRLILLIVALCAYTSTIHAQLSASAATVEEYKQPLQYYGHLDVNGLVPLKLVSNPNDLALEVKYWFSKTPTLKSGFGVGWQLGFNEGYDKNTSNLFVDGLVGNELAYIYNYLSFLYKLIAGGKKIRPYAEIGGGWLFVNHQFVDRPLNPDYDPNHSCSDGANEFLRNTTSIKMQNQVAVDAEVGLNFHLSNKLSLNVGIGSIISNKVAQLERDYDPTLLENVAARATSYQFKNNFLHAPSFKLGISILLFGEPCSRNMEAQVDRCCNAAAAPIIYSSNSSSRSNCRY